MLPLANEFPSLELEREHFGIYPRRYNAVCRLETRFARNNFALEGEYTAIYTDLFHIPRKAARTLTVLIVVRSARTKSQ